MNCEICQRTHDQNGRRACHPCQHRLATHLDTILQRCIDADLSITSLPARNPDNNTTGKPGSRPPLNLNALDAENTLLELVPGDPSSTITTLAMLEMWAIEIRHERHLTPHGPATATSTDPLLTHLHKFHHTHLDHVTSTHSQINLTEYADQLRRAARQLAHWNPNQNPPTWRIPCPTLTTTSECGTWLVISHDDLTNDTAIQCRNGHDWTTRRLIHTAGTHNVWLDATTIAHHLGITDRTIRNWHKAGHIRKQGTRYSWTDARDHARNLTA